MLGRCRFFLLKVTELPEKTNFAKPERGSLICEFVGNVGSVTANGL